MRGAALSGLPNNGAVLAEITRDIAAEQLGVFVGFDHNEPRAAVVGHLPTSAFMLAPMVTLAYSEKAPRALVLETGRRLREWIMANGFDRTLALSQTLSGRAFTRVFRHFGRAVGAKTMIIFALGDGNG
jgi:hypothetical protein